MLTQKESKTGKTPRNVIRGVNSHKKNEIGLHWLRISVLRQYLTRLRSYCCFYFGDSTQDGYGLWSYDSRYSWSNGASLNYDSANDRSDSVHQSKVTLDIPGRALDAIAETDLHLFLLSLRQFSPTCTRCDVFFDDYERNVTPEDLERIVKKKDFSGFREWTMKQQGRPNPAFKSEHYKHNPQKIKPTIIVHDEIDFGRRGQNGCGKYLRVYDKTLESKGEKDCVRWEIEFSKERAHKVFDKLSQVSSVKAFVTLCGSLIAGAIVFVHRHSEKNIGRLRIYNFWEQIVKLLGKVVIRVPTKKPDITGMYHFIDRQVSPTLACLRDTFTDDGDFFNWLFDVLAEGELRMSQRQTNLAKANKRSIRYTDGKIFSNEGEILSEL